MHVWQGAIPVGVLDPDSADGMAVEQDAKIGCDPHLAWVRTRALHDVGVGLGRSAGRQVTKRRDHYAGVEQYRHVVAGDCSLGQRRRVTRQERQHVAWIQRKPRLWRTDIRVEPVALAKQAKDRYRQRWKVSGADRAVSSDRRSQAAIDAFGEHLEHACIDARAADGDLVSADCQHAQADLGRDQRPGPAGVTSSKPKPGRRVARPHLHALVGTDASRASVDAVRVDRPGGERRRIGSVASERADLDMS